MNILSETEKERLLEIILGCGNCNSIDIFLQIAQNLEELLQADYIVFLGSKKVFPSMPDSVQEINVSYPVEWIEIYRAQNYFEVDPITTSGETGLLYWKDLFLKRPPDKEFHLQAKSFGLANGFSHVFSNQQIFGLISVAGKNVDDSSRTRTIINTLAPHFHQLVQYLIHKRERGNIPRLTSRQREVLLWAMEGKSNWEISVILGLSQESIKGHIAKILRKLNANNRTHAVAIAMQHNLLFPFGPPEPSLKMWAPD